MKITEREKRILISLLDKRVADVTDILVYKNASDREWDKVQEYVNLSTYIKTTLIDENYVR